MPSLKSKQYHIKFKLVTLEPDNYHIVLKASIEGRPLNVIIDTGASHSCFDLNFIRDLLPELSMEDNDGLNVGVGTSDFESKLSTIQNLRLGRFLLKQYDIVLLDMSNINEAYKMMHKPLIHGIIGSDFLMKYQAVIDYGSGVLTLQRDKKEGESRYARGEWTSSKGESRTACSRGDIKLKVEN